jgi:hypothetical protein
MRGHSGHPRRVLGAIALGLAGLLLAHEAAAQFGNMCQTNFGACMINPSPVGSGCICFAANGQIPGVVLGGGYAGQSMTSPFCRTFRGVCNVGGHLPVGSPCACYGDPGQITPP